MNFESIENSLSSFFRTNVPGLTVVLMNSGQDTPDKGTWCELDVDWGTATQIESGNPMFRYPGILNARIHTDIGIGEAPALAVADRISTAFRAKTVGSCKFFTPRLVKVGRVNKSFRINVLCPFNCDEV